MEKRARSKNAAIAFAHLDAAMAAGEQAKAFVSSDYPKAALDLIGIMHARMADAHRALDEIQKAIDEDAAVRDVIDDTLSRADGRA